MTESPATDAYTVVTLSIDGVAERTEYCDIGPVEVLTGALARVGHPSEVLGHTQQSIGRAMTGTRSPISSTASVPGPDGPADAIVSKRVPI
ncbi:hypothetical protein [Nocardia sp. NPDC049707]|uniref:hypothetical protein n=1 Tax=Nocardia sp. NPDC049707 TaxID=3154735 RepID=UPI0034401282